MKLVTFGRQKLRKDKIANETAVLRESRIWPFNLRVQNKSDVFERRELRKTSGSKAMAVAEGWRQLCIEKPD